MLCSEEGELITFGAGGCSADGTQHAQVGLLSRYVVQFAGAESHQLLVRSAEIAAMAMAMLFCGHREARKGAWGTATSRTSLAMTTMRETRDSRARGIN